VATPSFEPTRAKWYGVRTSNPTGLTAGNEGAWWYRSDLDLFAYWDGSSVHYIGGMGGAFATASRAFTIPIGGGCVGGLLTVTGITTINYVVSLTVTDTDPDVCDVYTPQRISIAGNIVGITIGGATGTTVTVEALVSGW